MVTLYDQLGIAHLFGETPERIISLVPSQTELLCDLGLEDRIVGVTKFCVHPQYIRSAKVVVGGTKNVNYEKIRLLEPDIIICNKEENTLDIVEELTTICPVWVTNIITIDDNFRMISDFGAVFKCEAAAIELNRNIEIEFDDFRVFVSLKPIKKVAYFIWKKPYMVAGSDNFINEMLKVNRFENIYGNSSRYPEVQIEDIIADGNPELILLSSEPFPFKEKDAKEIQQYALDSKIIIVDGEMFSWYGSRLLKSFLYFKQLHQSI